MSSIDGLRTSLEHRRGGPRRALDRVRTRAVFILQCSVAAGLAWELGQLVQPNPYFAPIAAVIALSAARGQHLARAVELAFGVAVGILVADLLLALVGTNGATVAIVVGLSMIAALLFGAGQILVTQAAVSASLLATLGIPAGQSSFSRFFSAMIGVAVALVCGPIFIRRDPMREVGRTADMVLAKLADVLERIADAFERGDPDGAHEALEIARSVDDELAVYEETLAAADESIRLTPPRRRELPRLAVYRDAQTQVGYAVRNVRVLARATETATVRGVTGEPALVTAMRRLGRAVRALGEALRVPDSAPAARALARRAAGEATDVLEHRSDLSANLIVAQIRSTAADLLRGSGMETEEMRVALGPYPGPEPTREEG